MNIAQTPKPAATPAAPTSAPAPAPAANTPSGMPSRARSTQRSIRSIPDFSSKAPAGPDVAVPIDDGDLGGYSAEHALYEKPSARRTAPDEEAPAPDVVEGGDETEQPETSAEKPTTAADKKAADLSADLGDPESVEDEAEEQPAAEIQQKPAASDKPTGKKDSRNYSVFQDPTMEKIARSLPNHLFAEFARMAPQWKAAMEELPRLREAANKVPSFHYEHQDGYLLSPEWPQLQQSFNSHQNEVSHWDRQLIAIENGEPWQDLIGYDNTGRPQYATIPAPKDGRVDVRARLHAQTARQRADMALMNTQAAAQNLVATYGQRRQQALETVKEYQKRLFPGLDPEKLEGVDKEAYDNAQKLIEKIDSSFGKHPATEFTKRMYVTLMRVSRQGIKWKQELDKANAKLKGKTLAQNTRVPSGGGGEGDETDDLIPIEKD